MKTFTMKNGDPAIVCTEVTYPTVEDAETALSLVEKPIRHLFDVYPRIVFDEPDYMGRQYANTVGWRIRWTGGETPWWERV